MMGKSKPKKVGRRKPGPEAERLVIPGDPGEAIRKILRTPRPKGGWPDQK